MKDKKNHNIDSSESISVFCYIIDSNVFAVDPNCIDRFGPNVVVVPLIVIEILDTLKSSRGLTGENANKALFNIGKYTQKGPLRDGVVTDNGGMLFVAYGAESWDLLNTLGRGLANKSENLILLVARNWMKFNPDHKVVLVTNNLATRIKASTLNIESIEYTNKNHIIREGEKMLYIPAFTKRHFEVGEKKVFVLMPFDDDLTEIYTDYIKQSVIDLKMNPKRADEIYNVKPIMEDIWREINEARVVIADLTNRNPNVLYETAIAHVLGKPVVLISQKAEDIPFDLRHLRVILYDKGSPRSCKKLGEDIQKTMKSLLIAVPDDMPNE